MALNDRDARDVLPDGADARIASLYKESSRETPPAHLDRRIAVAARAGAPRDLERRLPWWTGWRLPLAAAAIGVVSASLIALMLHEDPERLASVPPPGAPSTIAEEPGDARAPNVPADAQISATPEARGEDAPARKNRAEPRRGLSERRSEPPPSDQQRRADAQQIPSAEKTTRAETEPPPAHTSAPAAPVAQPSREVQEQALEPRSTVAAAPIPAPAPEPVPAAKPAPREMRTAPPSANMARPAPPTKPSAKMARPPSPAPAPETSAPPPDSQAAVDISRHLAELEKAAPAAWLERVHLLRREGRSREAVSLLAEFRKRYPFEAVPPDLQ